MQFIWVIFSEDAGLRVNCAWLERLSILPALMGPNNTYDTLAHLRRVSSSLVSVVENKVSIFYKVFTFVMVSYRSVNHKCHTRCAHTYQDQLTLSRCNPVYSRTTVKATRSPYHDSHIQYCLHPNLFPGLLYRVPALCLPFIPPYLAGNRPAPGGPLPVLHPSVHEVRLTRHVCMYVCMYVCIYLFIRHGYTKIIQ